MWCWCEPSRDVCENLVLNGNNRKQPPASKLAARNSAVLLWAPGVGVEHVGPGHGKLGARGCVPHAVICCPNTGEGKETRSDFCHFLAFHGRDDHLHLSDKEPKAQRIRDRR